jgi:hypothetical protein
MRSDRFKQKLRFFLEEDQRNSDAYISVGDEEIGEGTSTLAIDLIDYWFEVAYQNLISYMCIRWL